VRHVELQAGGVEGRRQRRLVARTIDEVHVARRHRQVGTEHVAQDRARDHEAARVALEVESRGPRRLVVGQALAQPRQRGRVAVQRRRPHVDVAGASRQTVTGAPRRHHARVTAGRPGRAGAR
jgi:hypothetical protein